MSQTSFAIDWARGARALSAITLTCAIASAAGVTVLDKPQLGTFASIQEAVDAAADGDVLLVQPGSQSGFVIEHKSLSVVASAGSVFVNGTTKVVNLHPDQSVTLIGMLLVAVDGQPGNVNGLQLINDAGVVRVEYCIVRGARYLPAGGPPVIGDALRAVGSSKVLLSLTSLYGHNAGYLGAGQVTGADAIDADHCSIALYDCTLKGGRGSQVSLPAGGTGGAACRVSHSEIFISGSTLTGGEGGDGGIIGCTYSGDGGDALVLDHSEARLIGATLEFGTPGFQYTCDAGYEGQALVTHASVAHLLSGTRRKMTGPSIATDNLQLTLNFIGEPGDRVELLVAKHPEFLYVPLLHGVVAIPSPWSQSPRIPVGVIGPSGTLAFHYLPSKLHGTQGRMWRVQGYCVNHQAEFITSPVDILILDG